MIAKTPKTDFCRKNGVWMSNDRQTHMSEATSKLVDQEVKRIVDAGYERARKILTDKIEDLHKLAKALLEFETRIYNNIKLSTVVPIERYEVLPGFFRESTYSSADFLKIYGSQFLNWAGQNRIDYKTQTGYTSADKFSYNYYQSANKLTNTVIDQGYWRGVYEYFYGTSQPNIAPWEMLGFSEMPTWWTAQYGAAPYTNSNGVMWADIEAGIIYNTGGTTSVTVDELKRPGLSTILPVDDHVEPDHQRYQHELLQERHQALPLRRQHLVAVRICPHAEP
jgi:hypothetical protein